MSPENVLRLAAIDCSSLIAGKIVMTPQADARTHGLAGLASFGRILVETVETDGVNDVTVRMVPVRGFEPRFDG